MYVLLIIKRQRFSVQPKYKEQSKKHEKKDERDCGKFEQECTLIIKN